MLRALRRLCDEGLLEFRHGRRITVTGTHKRSAAIRQAKELLDFARHHGYRADELVKIVQHVG